jgi:hypothetical protein
LWKIELEDNEMKVKHSRTYHLPWSPGVSSDDRVLRSTDQFEGHRVIVTEKRDGECTSLYRDGTVHARSIDGTNHPWQDAVKAMWRERCIDLPEGWRVVGENLYAEHSIRYDNLTDWIEVFAIFDETNTALSWDETLEWSSLLGLWTVPVLWKGLWDEDQIRHLPYNLDSEKQEGFVVRVDGPIAFEDWDWVVAKWVRKGHVQTDQHWTKTWRPNSKG